MHAGRRHEVGVDHSELSEADRIVGLRNLRAVMAAAVAMVDKVGLSVVAEVAEAAAAVQEAPMFGKVHKRARCS